jgi:predicted PurR-regulated permease PerM
LTKSARWLDTAAKIRTVWFLLAMIPVAIIAGLVGLLSLVIAAPLTIYAAIAGKHLKDPRKKTLGRNGSL